jgi:hypothetical protein
MSAFRFIAGAAATLYDRLVAAHDHTYDPKNDTLTIGFSVGERRGAARVSLDHNHVEDVADALDSFDPSAPLDTATVVERSLSVEEEDGVSFYSFKVSDADRARTIRIPVADFGSVVSVVNGYDPSVESSPAQMVRRTIEQKDGVVSFKVSDAPNTRAVRVPVGEDYDGLRRFLRTVLDAIPAGLDHYRSLSNPTEATTAE